MKRHLIIMAFFLPLQVVAQNADLANLANKVLSLLDESGRKHAQYDYNSDERFNWAFVPKSRNGISFEAMDQGQKNAVLLLIKASLSAEGYNKARAVITLEGILREVEGRGSNDNYRDPRKYFLTIFGQPSATEPWGWRLEGHHLSLNFTSVQGLIESSTPSFMGSNPAVVPIGSDKGKEVLKDETELGFQLINALPPNKLKVAVFSEKALPEIVSFNARKAKSLEPKGISYKLLSDSEKKIFMDLLNVYVKNYQLGFSNKLMDKITKAGIDNLSFAWAGSTTPGNGNYYRIQGPMLLIEYDNTQNNANHVHTVVRDLTNDFAEDILREHYRQHHN
jgi:hypothetical protein